jgi:uncharacterized protein (TIGR03435 family)
MRVTRLTALLVVVAILTVLAQTASGPVFDVVSIKKNTGDFLGENGSAQRPDGGFRQLNTPIGILISRAYPPVVPIDMVGLPDWAMKEFYDVIATSPLQTATPDQRIAMLRAMLADRFRLAAHMENREQEVYELVLARKDRRLGPNIKPSEVDCVAKRAADAAAGVAPWMPSAADMKNGNVSPPACSAFTFTSANHTEGDWTMESFAKWVAVNIAGRRHVVDKTGLSGSYRVKMDYDSRTLRATDTPPSPDSPPSIFTALQEQLGLKLEAAKVPHETLIIDHIERPTEN